MPLNKKIAILLAASSMLLAFALFFWRYEAVQAAALAEQQRHLVDTEQKLIQLARDIKRYEAARGLLGAGGEAMARHEKIALAARFTTAELARINEVLARAYEGDGFLLLKNFSLGWQGGESQSASGESLQLEMTGEKVFLR